MNPGPLPLPNTKFDGYSINFWIDVDGEQVHCAISLAALDMISGERRRGRPHLISAFQSHERQIRQIASSLFRRRPDSVDGTIRIWENDVEDEASWRTPDA